MMHPEDMAVFAKKLNKFMAENKQDIDDLDLDVDFDNILFDIQVAIDRAEENYDPQDAIDMAIELKADQDAGR